MSNSSKTIAVLLCTFNGARHLGEQLDSIVVPPGWLCQVHASDDASIDDTAAILKKASANPADYSLSYRKGPCQGHVANFLSLVCDTEIEGDVFAYCDQDDIWSSDKLTRAVTALTSLGPSIPALYCARTKTVDEVGKLVGLSPNFSREPAFANALVHNIGGGNTMVMNASARQLILKAGMVDVVAHDWWTYLLVAGAGGQVVYDKQPALDYRQHGRNQIGANTGPVARMQRYTMAFSGRNRAWNTRNVEALYSCRALLTKENMALLDDFDRMRNAGLFKRLLTLYRAGFYAQTLSGNIGLVLATIFKKI